MRSFCWHNWTPWVQWFVYGASLYQRRYCLKCMTAGERYVGWASEEERKIGMGTLEIMRVATGDSETLN